MRLHHLSAAFLLLCAATTPRAAGAQDTATVSRTAEGPVLLRVRLADGTTLVGRIVSEDSAAIRVLTAAGTITVRRSLVTGIDVVERANDGSGDLWYADPSTTRLFFAPTGRTLRRGEGYIADHYLLLITGASGVTDRFTFAGGLTIIPSNDPLQNVFYVAPKVGLVHSEHADIAAGVVAAVSGIHETDRDVFGLIYGVGTFGTPQTSLTTGLAYGYVGSSVSRRPTLLIGGSHRVSRSVALVTENYIFPGSEFGYGVSYGIRLMSEHLATDLAFINGDGSSIFPGIPYVAVTFKF